MFIPLGELDSYMFQTVGHEGISLYAEAMQIPLFQEITQGKTTLHNTLDYQPQENDEVEDLYHLLKKVKVRFTIYQYPAYRQVLSSQA